MKTPWLIQRCMLDTETKELKGRLRYDHMGSAEFEFGALPRALRELFALGELVISERKVTSNNNKSISVWLVYATQDTRQYPIQALSENEIRLKEQSGLTTAIKVYFGEALGRFEYYNPNINVWFDIENHVLFTLEKRTAKILIEQLNYIRKMWNA